MFPEEGLQELYQDFCFRQGLGELKQAFEEHQIPFDNSLVTTLNSAVTLADFARIEKTGNLRFGSGGITANEAYGLPILDALGIPKESLQGLSMEDLGDFQRSVRKALHFMQDGFRV